MQLLYKKYTALYNAILLKFWIPILEMRRNLTLTSHGIEVFYASLQRSCPFLLFDKLRSSSSKETRATAVDLLLFLSIDVAKLSASVRISSKLARFLLSFDSFDPSSESEKSESSTTGVPPDDFAPVSFAALKATVADSADTLRANPTKDKDSVVHAKAAQRRRTTRWGSKDRLPGLPRTRKKVRTFPSSRQRPVKTKIKGIEWYWSRFQKLKSNLESTSINAIF